MTAICNYLLPLRTSDVDVSKCVTLSTYPEHAFIFTSNRKVSQPIRSEPYVVLLMEIYKSKCIKIRRAQQLKKMSHHIDTKVTK